MGVFKRIKRIPYDTGDLKFINVEFKRTTDNEVKIIIIILYSIFAFYITCKIVLIRYAIVKI